MSPLLVLGLLFLVSRSRDAAARTANANAVKEVTASSGIKYRVTLLRSFGNGQNEYNVDRFMQTSPGFNGFVALITYRQNANGTRVLTNAPGGAKATAVLQARKDFGV